MSTTVTKNISSNRLSGGPRFGLLLELSFLLFAVAFLVVASGQQSIQSFSLIFTSIILEALPFMLFGSMVGGLVEVFISRERMTALLPQKRPWLAVLVAGGLGLVFPVCECAVVPVVRRLARKGLPVGAAIAYLLAGPIVNPVVASSTALAYKFDYLVVSLRLGWGYVIAVVIGLVMSRLFRSGKALRADLHLVPAPPCSCGTDHSQQQPINESPSPGPTEFTIPLYKTLDEASSCGCGHDHNAVTFKDKMASASRHAADDFLAVGHFLVIGAFIAALAQTYIERKMFLEFTGHFGISSMLMMTLAVLLNLCSEADAFIAASFKGLMSLPAQVAFLLTGPMFDLKLLLMYQSLFRKRAIVVLATLILLSVLMVSLFLELTMGGNLS